MAEISKSFKIFLIAYAVAGLIFSILFLVPGLLHNWLSSPYTGEPVQTLMYGLSLLLFAIFGILAVLRKEWMQIRIFIELATVWIVCAGIVNIVQAFDPNLAGYPQLITTNITLATIALVLSAIAIVFYVKEQKKSKN